MSDTVFNDIDSKEDELLSMIPKVVLKKIEIDEKVTNLSFESGKINDPKKFDLEWPIYMIGQQKYLKLIDKKQYVSGTKCRFKCKICSEFLNGQICAKEHLKNTHELSPLRIYYFGVLQ